MFYTTACVHVAWTICKHLMLLLCPLQYQALQALQQQQMQKQMLSQQILLQQQASPNHYLHMPLQYQPALNLRSLSMTVVPSAPCC